MKVILLTKKDIDKLLLLIDRDPRYGWSGGSSQVLSQAEQQAQQEAHKFFNFQIRRWIDEVSESKE